MYPDDVQIRFAILDEADRMLSDGFEEDVERILATSPPDRQTLLFRCGVAASLHRPQLGCTASSPHVCSIEPTQVSCASAAIGQDSLQDGICWLSKRLAALAGGHTRRAREHRPC